MTVLKSSFSSVFSIDSLTGVVQTIAPLDYEKEKEYELTVTVSHWLRYAENSGVAGV